MENFLIPKGYESQYQRIRNKRENLKDKENFDVILDPIECLPIEPGLRALNAGNWANSFLGVSEYYEKIKTEAKRRVVVFVFDTGGTIDHPALKNALRNDLGRSFTGEDEKKDDHGHSTHVAGCIAAIDEDASLGVARMLVQRGLLEIIPYKVLNNSGAGSYAWIDKAVQEANRQAEVFIKEGAFIIYNFSLGGGGSSPAIESRLKQADELGVFICAASGNTGNEGIGFPAKAEPANAIGSISQNGERSRFSSWGNELFILAPGERILSTFLNNNYRELSGTSMATPIQVGIVAIVASVYPDLSNQDIKDFLAFHAKDLGEKGRDKENGFGVNILKPLLEQNPDPKPEPPKKPGFFKRIWNSLKAAFNAIINFFKSYF